MYNAAFRALGLDWRYLKLPVPPGLFAETVRALPASGYAGVNVTIPHKVEALALAEEATEAARAIGAANTLSFAGDRVVADNTDAGGFLDALGQPVEGLSALVLGAGGAGRAVAWALRRAGAASVSVWNRTPARAEALARELGVRPVAAPAKSDLLVNATAVGLGSEDDRAALDELGLGGLAPPPLVVDLVYGRRQTPVCAWAAAGGSRVIDGLEVLVRQGARSFERWTGREAPLAVMREAV